MSQTLLVSILMTYENVYIVQNGEENLALIQSYSM